MYRIQLPNSSTTVTAKLLGGLVDSAYFSNPARPTTEHDNGIAALELKDGRIAIANDMRGEPYNQGKARPTVICGSKEEVGTALADDDRAQALWHLADLPMPGRFDTDGYPRLTATSVSIYTIAAVEQQLLSPLLGLRLTDAGDQRQMNTWRIKFSPLQPDAFDSVAMLREFVARLRIGGHFGISADEERLLVERWQVWYESETTDKLLQLYSMVAQ